MRRPARAVDTDTDSDTNSSDDEPRRTQHANRGRGRGPSPARRTDNVSFGSDVSSGARSSGVTSSRAQTATSIDVPLDQSVNVTAAPPGGQARTLQIDRAESDSSEQSDATSVSDDELALQHRGTFAYDNSSSDDESSVGSGSYMGRDSHAVGTGNVAAQYEAKQAAELNHALADKSTNLWQQLEKELHAERDYRKSLQEELRQALKTIDQLRAHEPAQVQQRDDTIDGGVWLDGFCPDCGYPLPAIMRSLGAKVVIVSTTENGPGPAEGEFKTPVMSALERLAGFMFPSLIGCYDFQDSFAAKELKVKEPDVRMSDSDWSENQEAIRASQWFSYWSGRVRSGLQTLLLSAEPLPRQIKVKAKNGGNGKCYDKGGRHVIAVSIHGGLVTRTEREALPALINGVISDVTTRNLVLGNVNIHWVHFDTVQDFLKCMQGFGGIDFGGAMNRDQKFDMPGKWTDGGEYRKNYDLLNMDELHGETPEARREFLLAPPPPDGHKQIQQKLHNAIKSKSAPRVRELLGLYREDDTTYPIHTKIKVLGRTFWKLQPGREHVWKYDIQIESGDKRWQCSKRWSEMFKFDAQLKKSKRQKWKGEFPNDDELTKVKTGDDERLKSREQKLQTYLDEFAKWANQLANKHNFDVFADLLEVQNFLADARQLPLLDEGSHRVLRADAKLLGEEFIYAAEQFNLEAMESLLAAGADRHYVNEARSVKGTPCTAIFMAKQAAKDITTKDKAMQKKVDAVIELCERPAS